MFLFGHLGIGSKLISPWTKGLPKKVVLIGTILPDLIDKPLYYGLSFITGKQAADLGLICGTRTFGHTALFLVLLTAIAILRKSKIAAALSLGVASHLLLDSLMDSGIEPFKLAVPVLWPLPGWPFPTIPFHTAKEYFHRVTHFPIIACEIIGILLLVQGNLASKPKVGRGRIRKHRPPLQ